MNNYDLPKELLNLWRLFMDDYAEKMKRLFSEADQNTYLTKRQPTITDFFEWLSESQVKK